MILMRPLLSERAFSSLSADLLSWAKNIGTRRRSERGILCGIVSMCRAAMERLRRLDLIPLTKARKNFPHPVAVNQRVCGVLQRWFRLLANDMPRI